MFQMPTFQEKLFTRYLKDSQNTGRVGGEHSVETVSQEAQMLDLVDKNFKSAILNVFRD